MKVLASLCCALLLALAGCVTKGEAEAKSRAAFAAGQQQAMARMQPLMQGPTVTVLGEVRNPAIPWTPDLTLAKVIVAAGYYGRTDPTDIVIVRNGQSLSVNPKTLLRGEDVPLLDHDVVAIRR